MHSHDAPVYMNYFFEGGLSKCHMKKKKCEDCLYRSGKYEGKTFCDFCTVKGFSRGSVLGRDEEALKPENCTLYKPCSYKEWKWEREHRYAIVEGCIAKDPIPPYRNPFLQRVKNISALLTQGELTQLEIAEEYDVSVSFVAKIRKLLKGEFL